MYRGDLSRGMLVQHLSIGGVIEGSIRTSSTSRFTRSACIGAEGSKRMSFAPPNLWIMLAIAAGLCLVGAAAARMRIRAVEVVTG